MTQRSITTLYTHMEYYRNLPHFHPVEAVFFITIRLAGSIPVAIIEMLKEKQEMVLKQISSQNNEAIKQQKRYFARFDEFLDNPQNDPYWLTEPAVADVVTEALHFRDKIDYDLIAYCLMSNHIHFIIDTKTRTITDKLLFRVLQSFKRHTAREANSILNRTGAFWHSESYDHIVKDNGELNRIIWYVLQNPVKVGLVENWQDWSYTYVNKAYWE